MLQVHHRLTPRQAQKIFPSPKGPIKTLPARGLCTPSTPPDLTFHPWHTTPVLNENTQERQSETHPQPQPPSSQPLALHSWQEMTKQTTSLQGEEIGPSHRVSMETLHNYGTLVTLASHYPITLHTHTHTLFLNPLKKITFVIIESHHFDNFYTISTYIWLF